MKLTKILATTTLALIIGNASDIDMPEMTTDFHCGSIKEMDRIIDARTTASDVYMVSRLVDIYPNTIEDKRKIVSSVIKYSEKYNIDALTLAAVLAKESSMNRYAKHSPVIVKIPLKKNWTKIGTKKVQAVGMGGVIFEIWKYELNEIGIKNRKDLCTIENNIKATAKILSIYLHERKQIKGTASKEESALLRYYGVIRDKRGAPVKTYSAQVYKIAKKIKKDS